MSLLDYSSEIFGIKINYTKSKAIWIGSTNITKRSTTIRIGSSIGVRVSSCYSLICKMRKSLYDYKIEPSTNCVITTALTQSCMCISTVVNSNTNKYKE